MGSSELVRGGLGGCGEVWVGVGRSEWGWGGLKGSGELCSGFEISGEVRRSG